MKILASVFVSCIISITYNPQHVECFNDDGVSLADKTTYAHNKVRYLHAVQNLVWDQTLADESQIYARVLLQENSLHHSEETGEYGENLYKGFDGFNEEKTIADAVFAWYDLTITGRS